MATTWTVGPTKVSFGNRRGIIGRLTFTGAGIEDLVTGLKRIDSLQLQAIASNTDNVFNVYRNTTGTTDDNGDAPGTAHIVNVSASTYSVIASGI
jgi:hypothetical protein